MLQQSVPHVAQSLRSYMWIYTVPLPSFRCAFVVCAAGIPVHQQRQRVCSSISHKCVAAAA